ncbi:hypothetical protein I6E74_10025 [Salinibacterium sp. SWN139]|uniref:hypothetical protein n=1 Tax=Salinibacterium sp. SWN139 TaxID=2792055 RepID=UPI0018CF9739|nr:hypothetical protein [Salinibacterium sp. SWN139]MBH0054501.1 hypothetical protein [Salinibacterium sp. SWN139]
MSTEVDSFSIQLLDEAKRFLEKAQAASDEERDAYLHAALMVGFSALESHLNGIADELSARPTASLLHNAILLEKDVKIESGVWELGREKFYRLEDRIAFLTAEYSKSTPSSYGWWSVLREGIRARNSLVHPREVVALEPADVERFLAAIIGALNDIYLGIFKKGHPAFNRGLQSRMTF